MTDAVTPRAHAGGLLSMAFGVACYLFFFGTFLFMIGFVANAVVPRTIDAGGIDSPAYIAVAVDMALLAIFALQHSIMARPAFKRAWTKIIPPHLERSVFVLAATACVALLIWQWRPVTDPVWSVSAPTVRVALYALQALGWGTALLSTFLINHFELFGLTQTFDALMGRAPTEQSFKTPSLYRVVRHPLYLGFIIAFFATPDMSVGHLLFALGGTGYILVGIFFEERDLIAHFGEKYRAYRKRVPMLLPFTGGRKT